MFWRSYDWKAFSFFGIYLSAKIKFDLFISMMLLIWPTKPALCFILSIFFCIFFIVFIWWTKLDTFVAYLLSFSILFLRYVFMSSDICFKYIGKSPKILLSDSWGKGIKTFFNSFALTLNNSLSYRNGNSFSTISFWYINNSILYWIESLGSDNS